MPSEVLIIIGIFDFELQFKLQDVIPKLETTLKASRPFGCNLNIDYTPIASL